MANKQNTIYMQNAGTYFKVSPEHYPFFKDLAWYSDQHGYPVRARPVSDTIHTGAQIRLSRLVMEIVLGRLLTNEEMVDHRNRNILDNTIENLRLASFSQNNRNRIKSTNINCTSVYKGVDYHAQTKKWRCRISLNDKQICIGVFSTEEDAARAYNGAAKLLHLPDNFYLLNKFPISKRNNTGL